MSRPNCYEIKGVHIALMARNIHPQDVKDKVQNGRSRLVSGVGSPARSFGIVETLKANASRLVVRLRDYLDRAD